jgi:hypothetical protein
MRRVRRANVTENASPAKSRRPSRRRRNQALQHYLPQRRSPCRQGDPRRAAGRWANLATRRFGFARSRWPNLARHTARRTQPDHFRSPGENRPPDFLSVTRNLEDAKMPETTNNAVATIDRLIAEIKVKIQQRAANLNDRDISLLLMLGREADGYMAVREILTGERRPSTATH